MPQRRACQVSTTFLTHFSNILFFYRATSGKSPEEEANKPGRYSKKYKDAKDELANRDEHGGLKFVYPYGSTINVRKPSYSLLSSGPISFPANRPVASFYMSLKRGKMFVIGSMSFFHDDFFEKEDNQKIQNAVFRWILADEGNLE
jgi:intraflagellar transport protein 52